MTASCDALGHVLRALLLLVSGDSVDRAALRGGARQTREARK